MNRKLKSLLQLTPEEEEQETYHEILEGTELKGYNFWILGFAMVIACIGLNIDSTSAIIGAMLISPLMGPIIGFSFGLAINDKLLKVSSIKNWFFMTLISLGSSILYFIISPFDFDTMQLSAFKNATIFDIFLAFFGGLAGFIGIVKKEGTKIIAGVAVATACMPPLCTAGFGIAHLNLEYTLGGIYFYFVNCLFIGLATFLAARFSKFHIRFNAFQQKEKTRRWLWIFFILAMTAPGLYLGLNKWKVQKNTITKKTELERIQYLEAKVLVLDSLLNSK